VFKNIIAPIQAWFLSQGRCVGCGTPLDKGKGEEREDGTKKVTCKCGRIFIYNPKKDSYRRALFEEV